MIGFNFRRTMHISIADALIEQTQAMISGSEVLFNGACKVRFAVACQRKGRRAANLLKTPLMRWSAA
jgi:hypothetical protein